MQMEGMEFRAKQILPPKSWSEFEDLCLALFKAVWNDPYAQKNGRSGQRQLGVDVFGSNSGIATDLHGVQCKGKDQLYGQKATCDEVAAELLKAEEFSPRLAHWIFATTAPVDAGLQQFARELTATRQREGKFAVTVLGWEAIQQLLADYPVVIEAIYPEQVFDIKGVVEAVRQLPSSADLNHFRSQLLTGSSNLNHKWQTLVFESARDLAPALMGRPLGPADADACPMLDETPTLLSELERAYSARLSGVPGAGKSVCSMQVARKMDSRGWRVVRLDNPKVATLALEENDLPTLYIVDDAHLTPPHLINTIEQATGPKRWLLSTFNTAHSQAEAPGTTRLDAKRAVRKIAASLRANRTETLRVVQKVDDQIGDNPFEESLDRRIDDAAEAEVPWQFCFILGGGWRRAKIIAASAKAAGADMVLVAAAARQVASRDSHATKADLQTLLGSFDVSGDKIDNAINWLINQRLLLSVEDLRTPHQRFSAKILGSLLDGANTATERSVFASTLETVVNDQSMSFIGIRNMLQELRMGNDAWYHRKLVSEDCLNRLVARCWQAETEEDRNFACLLISELQSYLDEWPARSILDNGETLANWANSARGTSAYGIGYLLCQIGMKDEALARRISAQTNVEDIARLASIAQPEQLFALAELLSGIAGYQSSEWSARFFELIDREHILELARVWPEQEYLSSYAKLCSHFGFRHEEFSLEMTQIFSARVAPRLRSEPINAFHEMDDIFWHVLRLHDPLGIYVGKIRPTAAMRKVGKFIARIWEPRDLAASISAATKRDFQSASGLLLFIRKTDPKRFSATVRALLWAKIERAIGEDWNWLDHDVTVFLSICSIDNAARKAVSETVERNADKIEKLPPRIAYACPETAYRHVERGREIALAAHGHFDWQWTGIVLAKFAQHRPALVDALLKPHIDAASAVLSNEHESWFREATTCLRLINQIAPDCFEQLLSGVIIEKAEIGWANALKGKAETRNTSAFLIHHAITRNDAVGDMARRLRERFPKQSVPDPKILAPLE
jgi:hypothetical protein